MNIEEPGQKVAIVGQGKQEVSLQLVQDVYNEVTGKTESLQQYKHEPHRVNIANLEILHKTMAETLEQYSVEGSHVLITASYANYKVEKYSSFSKFVRFSTASNSVIENVSIEYGVLVVLPRSKEPRTYKIEISVNSAIGALCRFDQTNASEAERRMFKHYSRITGAFKVDYVDIAFARTIEAMLNNWFDSLPKRQQSFFERNARSFSGPVSYATRVVSILGSALMLLYLFEGLTLENIEVFSLVVLSVSVLTSVSLISIPFAMWVSNLIEDLSPASYVHLSDCDEVARKKYGSGTLSIVGKVLLGSSGSIALSVFAAFIASKLGI